MKPQGPVRRGLNRSEKQPSKRKYEPFNVTEAIRAKVEREKQRHARWMETLTEEGYDVRPFSRRDAAKAWGCSPEESSDRLTELWEVGFIRRMRAEGFRHMWAFVGADLAHCYKSEGR